MSLETQAPGTQYFHKPEKITVTIGPGNVLALAKIRLRLQGWSLGTKVKCLGHQWLHLHFRVDGGGI